MAQTATRPTPTATTVADELDMLRSARLAALESLRTAAGWADFLAMAAHLPGYSLSDLLLVLIQRPDATAVADYDTWQAQGRQVRKGERGIRLLRPNELVARVFDIAQADPIAATSDTTTDTTRDTADATAGEPADPRAVRAQLAAYLQAHGATVTYRPIRTGAHGYTLPGDPDTPARVVIASPLDGAQQAVTLAHEAAHLTLGHLATYRAYLAHDGRQEHEATAVAHLVLHTLGLPAPAPRTGPWAETVTPRDLADATTAILRANRTLTTSLAAA